MSITHSDLPLSPTLQNEDLIIGLARWKGKIDKWMFRAICFVPVYVLGCISC